ncbi:hypothetical protein TUZN_0240 [Thermoproteus uzoniensis 768-20]|uniref:Uncharacterized protein n=1 Tax=Thermoproteus uzoniensis (strain 768-20) TaxID=999630 RepID=F2L1Z7_THEU7|nr:hypothetical protein [Thermoproteus uzoniensis]AEA11738.1 hypothetical protein TUZN_0240 [Thermoproteus uzoniensis 768-20]
MLTLPTPAVVAIGSRGGRLVAYDVEGGKFYDLPIGLEGIDVAELKIEGFSVRSHVAVASYATSFIKAIAVDGDAELLDVGGLRKMQRGAVTIQTVKGREFGRWDDVWNKLILIGGPAGVLAIGASRAGSLLHLSTARTDARHVKAVTDSLELLRKFGEVSVACSCRLGLLPVELLARRGTEYVLVKIYMNIQNRRSDGVVVIKGSGGNIHRRFIGPLENLNLFIQEVYRS